MFDTLFDNESSLSLRHTIGRNQSFASGRFDSATIPTTIAVCRADGSIRRYLLLDCLGGLGDYHIRNVIALVRHLGSSWPFPDTITITIYNDDEGEINAMRTTALSARSQPASQGPAHFCSNRETLYYDAYALL